MACQGSVKVDIAGKRGLKLWVFAVDHDSEISVKLLGVDCEAVVVLNSSETSCSVVSENVSCAVRGSAIPLCRWTRIVFALSRKRIRFQVGHVDFSRKLHFRAESVLFSSLHLVSTPAVFWSMCKDRPSLPENSMPTPKRFVSPVASVRDLLKIGPLRERTKAQQPVEGLLVCHDFMGNYLPSDRSVDTVFGDNLAKFAFTHWSMCNWFVYFSHHRVSIPPPSFVAAARANSCGLLGTFITEWKEGEAENVELFSQPERGARALAQLCTDFSFDG